MRAMLRLGILFIVAAAVLVVGCGGPSLKGSTWQGDGLLTGNVTLTFVTDTECQLGIRSVGATGTYSVAGDQVSVHVLKQNYAFTLDGDTMTGRMYAMTLTLTKQK